MGVFLPAGSPEAAAPRAADLDARPDEHGIAGVEDNLGNASRGRSPSVLSRLRLNAVVVAALKDPEATRRIRLVGMQPVPMTIEAFSAYVDSQIDRAARMQASGDK
jgi:tripartite-type tricarboxylate transporter receptor subunit TctC